jgi:hypothetical protein
MNIAFLTEMGFVGKIPATHPNMRTEFAWMHALDAIHHNIRDYVNISGYDKVFIIFPKGRVYLDAAGSRLLNESNPVTDLLQSNFIKILKQNNKQVYIVQEGPAWWFHNYEMVDQIEFINMIRQSDGIYAHNEYDTKFWKGYTDNVFVMPTLMIETPIQHITWKPEDKTIIGGNFSRWYGGMSSYIAAQQFENEIYTISSHSQRDLEDQVVKHLPRVMWTEWMEQLSTFKYAIHLMPTIAAGTFSLNCAYFGIPCIGNESVDTQRLCHPDLSTDVDDVERVVLLVKRLRDDENFYLECSKTAKENYRKYYNLEDFNIKIINNVNI